LIEAELAALAKRAWAGSTCGPYSEFELDSSLLTNISRDDIANALYNHARTYAPGLEVPVGRPAVTLVPDGPTAGSFKVSEAGNVLISVSQSAASTATGLLTVLAHEICHHIAESSWLSDHKNSARNERTTELLMFVCGFGSVVEKGRTGFLALDDLEHRKRGYLSTDEIATARCWTKLAWVRGDYQKSPKTVAHEQRVVQAKASLEDRERTRLLAGYRRIYPGRSDEWILDRMMGDLERDRR
jgi:hypothetical protein